MFANFYQEKNSQNWGKVLQRLMLFTNTMEIPTNLQNIIQKKKMKEFAIWHRIIQKLAKYTDKIV